jgi:hypothetical protein
MVKVRPRVRGLLAIALVGAGSVLLGGTGASARPIEQAGGMDACQLIGSAEASAYAGVAYDAGTPLDMEDGASGCAYRAGTTSVFTVIVAQAPDTDTAQAQWVDYEARAQALVQMDLPSGARVDFIPSDVSDLPADRAAVATGSGSLFGRTLNGSACYLLKGTTFVSFSDVALDQATPAPDAVEAEALNVLGRLP